MAEYHQGKYRPTNPSKYRGDPRNIIYRSGWELKLMRRLDLDKNVIQWSSEENVLTYKSPIDNRYHRYFVDMWVMFRSSEGTIEEALIEVKPHKQTIPPRPLPKGKKPTKSFMREVVEWGKNSAKWAAAREYCHKRGMKFIIMDEYALGIKKRR